MAHEGEIFLQLPRSHGDVAGVFEHDGRVGFFYLFDALAPEGSKVRHAIRVAPSDLELRAAEVRLLWNTSETLVGLMIRGSLCAVFDAETGDAYGGDFRPGAPPVLPEAIRSAFADE